MKFSFDKNLQTDICNSITKERKFYTFDIVKDNKVCGNPFLIMKRDKFMALSLRYEDEIWKGTIRKYDLDGNSIVHDDASFIPKDVLDYIKFYPDFTLNHHFVRGEDGCVYWKESQVTEKSEILDVCQFLAFCHQTLIETKLYSL